MKYLRLISNMGFWVSDKEAKSVVDEIYKNGKETIVIQGNLIPAHQIAGVFNANMGDEFEAKKRGLVLHRGEFYTKEEIRGWSVLRTDSTGEVMEEDSGLKKLSFKDLE